MIESCWPDLDNRIQNESPSSRMLPLIVTSAFLGPDTLYTLSLATTELSVRSRKGRAKIKVLQPGTYEGVVEM